MGFVYALLAIVVSFFAFFIGLRVFMVMRIKRQEGRPIPELAGKQGKAAKARTPSLFYFYSPQCGACRSMTPVIKKMPGLDRNVFAVDISKDMDTARRFGVMATPTTVLVREGVVQQILIGPQPESALRGLLA
ncbi:MAG: thioredoxin family protein [Pseudomonadota bacterium]